MRVCCTSSEHAAWQVREALLAGGQGLHVACHAVEVSATAHDRRKCQRRHLQFCKLVAQGQRLALPLRHLPPQPLLLLGMAFLQRKSSVQLEPTAFLACFPSKLRQRTMATSKAAAGSLQQPVCCPSLLTYSMATAPRAAAHLQPLPGFGCGGGCLARAVLLAAQCCCSLCGRLLGGCQLSAQGDCSIRCGNCFRLSPLHFGLHTLVTTLSPPGRTDKPATADLWPDVQDAWSCCMNELTGKSSRNSWATCALSSCLMFLVDRP